MSHENKAHRVRVLTFGEDIIILSRNADFSFAKTVLIYLFFLDTFQGDLAFAPCHLAHVRTS